ncbi:MAG TPA: dehydrogenase, partial [Desulfobulbaceae bacterium]|nr:dehydrogenase [Desulfobulbaceae bacterium]
YVQSRGESGLADGIYHFEPLTERLRLLHVPKPGEGLEGYFDDGCMVTGLVVLVTAIYYRSSWKYGQRALRYCLLDGGHILGAMEAAAYCTDRSCSWVTRFDRRRLQKDFGFLTRELPLAMGISGTRSSDRICRPQMSLDFVNGSGPFCRDPVIEQAFARVSSSSVCRSGKEAGTPYSDAKKDLKSIILRRRSIREFSGRPVSSAQYRAVCDMIRRNIALDCDEDIVVFSIVHRVEGMESGLYVDDRCLKKGDFAAMAGYLCLDQSLGADGAATFFLVGDSENYPALMLKAGLLGQRIYLASELQGLGCSGIGAFYDLEVADFLETDSLILYALAIGI